MEIGSKKALRDVAKSPLFREPPFPIESLRIAIPRSEGGSMLSKISALLPAVLLAISPALFGQNPSTWVYYDSNHKLQYTPDSLGNTILDFSWAGYQGGGVALPTVPVKVNLSPSGADDTANIQAAINQVAALPADFRGIRGAVQLAAGNYTLSAPLNFNVSGVTLRGAGSAEDGTGTILTMTGNPFLAFSVVGTGTWVTSGTPQPITDTFVPSGGHTVTIADPSSFKVGQTVLIQRPVTPAWIHSMGMDLLKDGSGNAQTWIGPGTIVNTDRVITAINGNRITFDAPLTDSFDSQYVTGSIVGYTFPGRISQVGIEHLRVVAPALNADISLPQFLGVQMKATINSWMKDVYFQDTQNTVTISNDVKAVTLDQVVNNHTVTHTGDRMADFGISGTEIFLNRCQSIGAVGEWPMVMQSRVTGPIVLLNFYSTQAAGIAPHQRWGTGMLADNAVLPAAPKNPNGGATGIAYQDRGNHGSGQGWAAGWSVAWNATTPYFVVQKFPGGTNWCIGCVGTKVSTGSSEYTGNVPDGDYDSLGSLVTPNSLYLAQLSERKGPAALAAIGYGDFNVAATPVLQAVARGATANYTVNVSPASGFSDNVELSTIGLPPGTNVQLANNTIAGGSGSTTLSVATSPSTRPGIYLFVITARDGNLYHFTAVSLVVH